MRGYGLVDSPKVDGEPGKHLNLTAVKAPNEAAAAQYYPAICWYSMLKIPDESQFGGKSDIPENITQSDWLTAIKNRNCIGCHQLLPARERPLIFRGCLASLPIVIDTRGSRRMSAYFCSFRATKQYH